MNKLYIQALSFILFLTVVPLISIGTTTDNAALWWAGIGIFIFASILPPITRFLGNKEEKKEDSKGAKNNE